MVDSKKIEKQMKIGKSIYTLSIVSVGLFFIMDGVAITLYYPNVVNILFVLLLYPVIIRNNKKHYQSYVKLINEDENKIDNYKQYSKYVALHLALVFSSFTFIKCSVDSIFIASFLFILSICFEYVATYIVLSSVSFIYRI